MRLFSAVCFENLNTIILNAYYLVYPHMFMLSAKSHTWRLVGVLKVCYKSDFILSQRIFHYRVLVPHTRIAFMCVNVQKGREHGLCLFYIYSTVWLFRGENYVFRTKKQSTSNTTDKTAAVQP